jgi:hypothetical protein
MGEGQAPSPGHIRSVSLEEGAAQAMVSPSRRPSSLRLIGSIMGSSTVSPFERCFGWP